MLSRDSTDSRLAPLLVSTLSLLYVLLSTDTRYHNYSQAEKVAEVERWTDTLGLPLDVVGLDMDWRQHPCYANSLTPNCSAYGPADEVQYVRPSAGSRNN